MSSIQAVILDLYGTLIDIHTHEDRPETWDVMAQLLAYYGAHVSGQRLMEQFRTGVAQSLGESKESHPEVDMVSVFGRVLEQHSILKHCLAEVCCKLFRSLSRERFELFPDSLPALRAIKSAGLPLGIISNAQSVFTVEEIRMLGLDGLFRRVILSSDYGYQKPDPRLFALACASLGVEPRHAVYIGDNPQADIVGAKQTGMKVVLLNRRAEQFDTPVGPDFQAASLYEAWEWVKRL